MNILKLSSVVSITVLLTACVSTNPNYGYNQSQAPTYSNQNYGYNQASQYNQRVGVVLSVRETQQSSGSEVSAPGVIIGGIAGGLLGNQIGGGKGKTLATIVGAAGGAYVGNEVAKQNNMPIEMLEIDVRQNNGQIIRITQPKEQGYFRNGDRVQITQNNRGQPYVEHF